MADTTLGSAVNFAFTGTDGIAATEFTGKILLQNADYSKSSEEEQVKDSAGKLVTRHFYNEGEKASLEYIVTADTIAHARAGSTVPAIATIINITACADLPDLVASNWIVSGEPKITGSNTSGKRVTLSLEAHPGITAVATAS